MKLNKYLLTSVLVASTVYLSGCVPALVGGAAATTYVAKDERTVGTIIDDATITTQIKAKLANDKLTSAIDIHVDTEKNNVTLSGTVHNHEISRRAVALAKNTKGVRSVINKLHIAH